MIVFATPDGLFIKAPKIHCCQVIATLDEMAGLTGSNYRMLPGWDCILNRNVLSLKKYTHPSEVLPDNASLQFILFSYA